MEGRGVEERRGGWLERAGAIAARAGSLRPADPRLRLGLYIGLALLIVLGVGTSSVAATLGDFLDHDLEFRPGWLTLGLGGFVVLVIVQAEVWRRLLHALGPPLDARRAVAIWSVSALGRYVPTGLLMPLMRAAMAERAGVPKRICLASVVDQLALGFSAALAVGAYFVVDHPDLQGHPERWATVAIPVAALAVLQPGVFGPLANSLLRALGRERLPLALGSAAIFAFGGAYVLVFLLAGLSVFALAQSVEPLVADDLPTVVGAFAVGTTVSIIAFFCSWWPGGPRGRSGDRASPRTPHGFRRGSRSDRQNRPDHLGDHRRNDCAVRRPLALTPGGPLVLQHQSEELLRPLLFRLSRTSFGLPCSMTTPSSMKTTVLAASRAKPISWVTTIIVMPSSASLLR